MLIRLKKMKEKKSKKHKYWDTVEELIRYNFVKLRQQKGFTQEKLADIAGKDKSYVGQIESGIISFSLRSQLLFSEIFNVDRIEFYKPKDIPDPLEARCLAACRKARELGLESALLEHLDMIEYKIEKAAHDPPEVKDVANLKY